MQMWVESKANASNIGTFIRFYIQMRVEKNPKHLPIDSIGHSHNSVINEYPHHLFTSKSMYDN